VLLLVVVALAAASPALAQRESAGWQSLSGLPGPIASLIPDPDDGSHIYALTAGGLVQTTDAGKSWSSCLAGARFARLVSTPNQPYGTALYAVSDDGIRSSQDGCATWKSLSGAGLLPSAAGIRWLAPYPNNPSILYAGQGGLGGLYRSTDAGATWTAASNGLPPGAWAAALTSDPTKPERVYLGVKYAGDNHPPAYVFRSTDGGLTWHSSSMGLHLLPRNAGEVTALDWSAGVLFAATRSDGLFASYDAGTTWAPANSPRRHSSGQVRLAAPAAPGPAGIQSLVATYDGSLAINTTEGAFTSTDSGASWSALAPPGASGPLVVGVDPKSARVAVADGKSGWTTWLPSPRAVAAAQPSPTPVEETTVPSPPVIVPSTPTEEPTAVAIAPTPTPRPSPTAVAARPAGWLPSDKAEPLDPSVAAYFPQTGHNVKYGFRDYWTNNDGLRLLGYPLTEEFEENGASVQYFERARLEYRNGKIVWGLVGTELTKGRYFKPVRFFPSEDTNIYFGPTQHSLSGPFLAFWRDTGGVNTLGYPISESIKDDGSEYQWFERGRIEWHPWLPEGQQIVLGLVGRELLQARGWIK
jgi:hypothetical protein